MDKLKKVYIETEDYEVTLEYVEGLVWIHAHLSRASTKIIHELQDVWLEILTRLYWEGFSSIYTVTQDERMLKLFPGSHSLGKFKYNEKEYEVVEWDLT